MTQLLSAVTPGTLVKLNENGITVEFYVSKHDYESGLNGPGRTLVVRKDCYDIRHWHSSNVNAYASSAIDSWLNGTYKNLLDADIRGFIGTTKFKYTPGNGNNTVGTLERAIFLLSATELNRSASWLNVEGTALEIASSLQIAYKNGSAVVQWTRSPYTDDASSAVFLDANGYVSYINCTNTYGSRPAFTLPSTIYVWNDGTVSQYAGPAPASITTTALIVQDNGVPVSWYGVSGADSYILQRKVDSGEWTQVYAGSDTTFTDTAGSWSTVQYQVCGVFSGVNGVFAQSDVITVVPASTLVISGQDGSLGTITSDIPYSVATNTGNQISLTRTVNGVLVASLTVDSGFSYSIPVMDLPTGTGTIVITATVQASGGPVTVKRTWTYTKQAQTFPGSGGLAQLTQDGQNMFPLTLAEAVKTIGGPWGGNLSTALDKLAKAATCTATAVPKYTQVSVNLATVQAGDIVNLPENGVMVPFYVASLDYEPTLNTGGARVLLVRKDVYRKGQWNSSTINTYAGSAIDQWFNSTYLPMLDSTVRAQIGTTVFYYTPGNGNSTITTLSRAIFALSLNELGVISQYSNNEGSTLTISNQLKIAYLQDNAIEQFTRTPQNTNTTAVNILTRTGEWANARVTDNDGYRPCFTLPATFTATYYVGQNGSVHAEQEYTTVGDFADLWGNIIPTVKIEVGSYVGTGTYGSSNANILTTPFPPKNAFITAESGTNDNIASGFINFLSGHYSVFHVAGTSPAVGFGQCSVEENTSKWWATGSTGTVSNVQDVQFNVSGVTYSYIIFG